MTDDNWFVDGFPELLDYEVQCARCGKMIMASVAMIEEGDEWECEPCWEVQESKQMVATRGIDFIV